MTPSGIEPATFRFVFTYNHYVFSHEDTERRRTDIIRWRFPITFDIHVAVIVTSSNTAELVHGLVNIQAICDKVKKCHLKTKIDDKTVKYITSGLGFRLKRMYGIRCFTLHTSHKGIRPRSSAYINYKFVEIWESYLKRSFKHNYMLRQRRNNNVDDGCVIMIDQKLTIVLNSS